MQRLCLEVFRQMLGLFKKHFGGAHVCYYDGPQTGSNQARMCWPVGHVRSPLLGHSPQQSAIRQARSYDACAYRMTHVKREAFEVQPATQPAERASLVLC
jgi:hypothetical protein